MSIQLEKTYKDGTKYSLKGTFLENKSANFFLPDPLSDPATDMGQPFFRSLPNYKSLRQECQIGNLSIGRFYERYQNGSV